MSTGVLPLPGNLYDILNQGPSGVAAQQAQRAAQTGLTNAQIPLTQAQVPLTKAQTTGAEQENQIRQRQIEDAEVWRRLLSDPSLGGQQGQPNQPQAAPQAPAVPTAPPSGPPAVGAAPPPAAAGPSSAQPQIATPAFNPNAPSPNSGMVADPVGNLFSNPAALAARFVQLGGSGAGAQQAFSTALSHAQALTKLDTDQLANYTTRLNTAGNALTGYASLKNPTDEDYAHVYETTQKLAPDVAATMPQPAQGFAPAPAQLGHAFGITKALETTAAQAKLKAETEAQEATTAAKNLETEKGRLLFNYQRQALQGADPLTAGPAALAQSPIFAGHAQELSDAQDAYRKAYQAELAKDPTNAANAGNEAAQKIADRLREFSPGVVKGKATEAAATLTATAPIQQRITQANAAYENALRQGDTASAEYFKSYGEANQSIATSQNIERLLDTVAQSGNKVSAQALRAAVPEYVNAMQGIKRMAAQQGEAGLSTTIDRIIDEGKSATGQVQINPTEQAEIRQFVHVVANGAAAQHNATVKALEATPGYGNKGFQKIPDPYQWAVGPKGERIMSRDGGQTWQPAAAGK